jgi:hypothetical protein
MRSRSTLFACAAVLTVGLLPTLASAQGEANPKFEYAKHEELKKVEWKALVKSGLMYSSGNSQLTNFTAGFLVSRKDLWNKFALDGGFAFAKSSVLVANDVHDATGNPGADGLIQPDEFYRSRQTSANQWNLKARYDRFFTKNNSGYVAGLAAGDHVAGKEFFGGGQAGYSRQIVKTLKAEMLGEIGYDFSYEKYMNPAAGTPGSVNIHSARLFLGGSYKLLADTILSTSIEVLSNLSKEAVPNWQTGTSHLPAMEDTRINYKAAVSTKLWKNVSLGVAFTLKYDNNPALRPAPKGFAFDDVNFPIQVVTSPTHWEGNHARFADKLDTLTELVLIVNFI